MNIIFLLVFLPFIFCYRPNPSFALTNFEDLIMGWCASQNSFTKDPERPAGICLLRSAKNNYTSNILKEDGFAFKINDKDYTDPIQFQGINSIEYSGDFTHKLKHYNKKDIEYINIQKNYLVVPENNIILENYYFENIGDKDITINILDFITTDKTDSIITSSLLKDGKSFYIDFSSDEKFQYLGLLFGMIESDSFTVKKNVEEITTLFKSKGHLDNSTELNNTQITGAFQKKITIKKGEKQTVLVYRGLAEDLDTAESLQQIILSKSYEQWQNLSYEYINKKFDSYKKVSFKDEDEKKMWYSCILTLLHSQNPTLGTLVASFHPAYQYKVWTRDASFASIILTALGEKEGAKKYLTWLSEAKLRDEGFLATNYDWFSGKIIDFVEPQYDSVGVSLTAYYYYYAFTKDLDFFTNNQVVKDRIRTFENFLLIKDYKDLIRPDYSIWEESSDGWSSYPLPVQYYAFSQIQGHLGLECSAMIEEKIYNDSDRANTIRERANLLSKSFEENFWNEQEEFYVQSIWSDTKLKKNVIDSSVSTMVFSDITTNKYKIKNHFDKVRKELTKLDYGIGRYYYDPYFFESKFNPSGKEAFEASPPWGVVTMFLSWAELLADSYDHHKDNVQFRLKWMIDHTGKDFIPCGEAIDSVSGEPVGSSMPDVYEHAGVYIMTVLQHQKLIPLFNYKLWN